MFDVLTLRHSLVTICYSFTLSLTLGPAPHAIGHPLPAQGIARPGGWAAYRNDTELRLVTESRLGGTDTSQKT